MHGGKQGKTHSTFLCLLDRQLCASSARSSYSPSLEGNCSRDM